MGTLYDQGSGQQLSGGLYLGGEGSRIRQLSHTPGEE
jgi:hypothetical protein